MKFHAHLSWQVPLAIGLVGCTSLTPTPLKTPSQPTTLGGAELQSEAPHGQFAVLNLRVRWPERQTQAIPVNAESLRIRVYDSANAVLGDQTLTRPSAGQPMNSTARFELDPKIGKVTIKVDALSGAGSVLAHGERVDLPITDNTATSVVVLLQDTQQGTVSLDLQLDLVKHLELYFSRFDRLLRYAESDEVKRFSDAAVALANPFNGIQTFFPGSGPWGGPPQGGNALSRVVDSERPEFWVELKGDQLSKLHWPGKLLENAMTETGLTHSLTVTLKPDGQGSELTAAGAHLEITANDWKPLTDLMPGGIPGLMLAGLVDGQPATRSVFPLPTAYPAYPTIQKVSAWAYFNPAGVAADGASLSVACDDMRNLTGTRLGALMRDNNISLPVMPGVPSGEPSPGPTPPPDLYFPFHWTAQASVPSLRVKADIRGASDLMSATALLDVAARNNDGVMEDFSFNVNAGYDSASVDGRETLQAARATVTMIDSAKLVRLVATYQGSPTGMDVAGRFEDLQTGAQLATLVWHTDSKTDLSRLAAWPMIQFKDGTSLRLTPGYLTGKKDGMLVVEVQ